MENTFFALFFCHFTRRAISAILVRDKKDEVTVEVVIYGI